jgi:Flp pilus assembly protein TadD
MALMDVRSCFAHGGRGRHAARPALTAAALVAAVALAGCASSARQGSTVSEAARLHLAQVADAAGDQGFSETLLEQAVQKNPADAEALTRLAVLREQRGAQAEAAALIARAVAVAPTPARWAIQGRIAVRTGNPAVAVAAYRHVLEAGPQDLVALNGLGIAYDLLDRHAEAEQAYRAALAVQPRNWDVRTNLGLSLVMMGRAADAIPVLRDAETDADAPRRARHNLALAFAAAGQRDRAVLLLRVSMGPAEAETLATEMTNFAAWLGTQQQVASR